MVYFPYICIMTTTQKSTLWEILVKYDNTMTSFCNSLSNAIQSKESNEDLTNIFSNYQNIGDDAKLVDSVLGSKILLAVN